MNKPLPLAAVAGAILFAVVLIGFFAFHALVPPPTPHPDPARFLPQRSGAGQASSAPALPGSH